MIESSFSKGARNTEVIPKVPCKIVQLAQFNFLLTLVISSRLSLAIEESAFKVWYYIAKTFGENQSVNYAELDEFKYVELIYYDVRQLH